MNLERVQIHDVMRITLADVTFDEKSGVLVIGGQNAQGKSAFLNAIEMGIGGGRFAPDEPIRRGAETGWTKVTTDALVIERKFSKSGTTTVKVSNRDGSIQQKPQALLDTLYNSISFDPIAFFQAKPMDQLNILKKLVGLDFTTMDADRKRLYDERTIVNRELDMAKKNLEQMRFHHDVPNEEVSISGLLEELKVARERNEHNRHNREELQKCNERFEKERQLVIDLENQLKAAKDNVEYWAGIYMAQLDRTNKLVDADEESINAKITGADAINSKVRTNKAYENAKKTADAKHAEANVLTSKIEAINAQKEAALSATKFPIPGLGFGESGVTFNGLPLDQASQAEKIRVSVAIGAAMSPELKLFLVRDGSLLDDKNMAMLNDLAKEYGCKILVERVGKEGYIVIEDGHVTKQEITENDI